MKKMPGIQGLSLLLIALVIMLPLYSADSLAATNGISNINVRGKDGVLGYTRNSADYYTFTARAFIEGETVNNTKVRLIGPGGSNGFAFDSCTAVGDGSFDCIFSRNMSDFVVCPDFTYTIRLFNQSDVLKDSKSIPAICDTTAPLITLSTDKDRYGANQNITFSFTLQDKARLSSSESECSGLLNFITLSSGSYSKNFQIFPEGCSHSAQVRELSSAFTEGVPTVTLTSYDLLGQKAEQSVSFGLDFTQPSIELKEFDIRKQDGEPILYFVPETYYARMVLEVTDNMLDTTSFNLDLSSLDVPASAPSPSCTVFNTTTMRCSITQVPIRVNFADYAGTIVATAADTLGNKKSRVIGIEKSLRPDTLPPDFENITIMRGTDTVTGVSSSALTNVVVSVDIVETDIGLDQNTVRANLNALNPKSTSYENVAKSSCTAISQNRTRCSWSSLNLDLGAQGQTTKSVPLVLSFKAADKAGNNASESLTYTIFVDTQGPIANEIGTDTFDANGTYFINGGSNLFAAEFTETGAGLHPNDVLLDISGLGGSSALPADNCSGTGTIVCIWNNVKVSATSGEKFVSINPLTKDRAGNALVDQRAGSTFIVDMQAPEMLGVDVTAVAASQGVLPGFMLTGNALEIVAKIREEHDLIAYLDASSFIRNATKLQADECIKIDSQNWRCIWNTDEINVKGFISNSLKLNITDVAGNSKAFLHPLLVTGIANKSVDVWKASVGSPSPAAIDKQLVNHYDPFIWFPAALTLNANASLAKNASRITSFATLDSRLERWPVLVTLDRCRGNDTALLSSLNGNEPELFNFNPGFPRVDSSLPYNLFFKFTLERALPPQDTVKFTCSVKIRTLLNNKEISPEETENITFAVNFFNNPLGTIDSRIDDEIERVQEGWLVSAQWLGVAQDILNYAQTACRVLQVLFSVWGILTTKKDVLSECCTKAPIAAPLCCSVAGTLGVTVTGTVEIAKQGWEARTSQFCKALNCQFFWGDWLRQTTPGGKGDTSLMNAEWAKNSYFEVLSSQSPTSKTPNSKDPKAWAKFYTANIDPKQSLVGSVAFLCLPGVIYNLQKARAIECRYINCLKETHKGMPVYLCSAQRSYAMCKYVWGQIFNLIPFSAALTQIGKQVTEALSHPLELVSTTTSVACYLAGCSNPGPLAPSACRICYAADTISWVTDVLCDLGIGPARCEPIWDRLKIDTDNACKDALKKDKKKPSQGTPTLNAQSSAGSSQGATGNSTGAKKNSTQP